MQFLSQRCGHLNKKEHEELCIKAHVDQKWQLGLKERGNKKIKI